MTFKISALPLSNIYDTFTFEFFPLEWMTPPPVSLLKSLTITNFILQVDFFPLFKVSCTIHSRSLLHSDPNVTCELRSNGSDLAPALLRQYCSCKFAGKMFSISAACCWKSNHVIVDDTMSSFWLPLALSSILNVIWKGSVIYCKLKSYVERQRDLPSSSSAKLSPWGSGSTGGSFLDLQEVGIGADFFLGGAEMSNWLVGWRTMGLISISEPD